jgi:O-antigen/teichoic acid export membrane protein
MNKVQLKSFLRGSAVSILGVIVLGLLNFFIRRTLKLNLSTTDFGFIYSAFSLVMMILLFIDLGLGQSTTILISKKFVDKDIGEANKIFTVISVVKIVLALAAFVILALLSPYIARYFLKYPSSTTMLLAILLILPAQTLLSNVLNIMSARKAFFTRQILMNAKALIVLAGVLFGITAYGVKSWIYCFVGACLLVAVIGYLVIKTYGISLISLRKIKFETFKHVLSFSSWIAVSTAGIYAMYYMDTICLTWLTNLDSVAMYNIALPLMRIAQSLFVFPLIFTPYVTEMWKKKDYSGIKRSCYIGSAIMLSTLPVFIFVGYYFAPDIITFMFDKESIAAASSVTVLWVGMVFHSIAGFNMNALNAGGSQKTVAGMVCACVVVNFTLNVILIPQYSYFGAALATATTYILMALASIICLIIAFRKKKQLKPE